MSAPRLVSAAMLHNLLLEEKPDYLKALYDGYYYMSQTVDNVGGAAKVSSQRVPVFTRKGDTVQGYYISQVVQRAIDNGGVTYDPVADDARFELQRLDYEYTSIRAPIAGVVSARDIKIGQHVDCAQFLPRAFCSQSCCEMPESHHAVDVSLQGQLVEHRRCGKHGFNRVGQR